MPTVEDVHGGEEYCYLTTFGRSSGQPREIEIWFAAVDDSIYLMNGGGRRPPGQSHWVLNLVANSAARVRIGGDVYLGRARVLERPAPEDERARKLLVQKYAKDERDLLDWRRTGVVVSIALQPDETSGTGSRAPSTAP